MLDEYVAFVKQQEGLRLKPYLDQLGVPTIGYGHVIPSLKTPDITEARAEQMLREDLAVAEEHALTLCPNLGEYPRKLAALTDLMFNVGYGNVKSQGAHTIAAFNRGDWLEAARHFRKWDKGRVNGKLVPLPVLTKRREYLAKWVEE